MRKLLFLSILLLIGFIGKSQKVYFIYLQSENATPFYVKMGDKIHSSSAAGYLILSNLKDSTYSFSIGLSRNRQIEPKFQITVTGSDYGFLIKELEQKLHLFNLQTFELVAPLASVEVKEEGTYISRTDEFTRTLSLAVNDPSLMIEVVRREPEKIIAKGKTAPNEVKEEVAIVKDLKTEDAVVVDSSIVVNTIDSTSIAVAETDLINKDSSTTVVSNEADSSLVAKADTTAAVRDTLNRSETVQLEETKKADAVKDSLSNEVVRQEEVLVAAKPATDSVQSMTITPDEKERNQGSIEYKKSNVVRRSESSTTGGFGLTFIDYMVESSDTIRIFIPNPKTIFKKEVELKSEPKENFNTIKDIEVKPQMDSVTQVDTIVQVDSGLTRLDTAAAIIKHSNGCTKFATEEDVQNLYKQMSTLDTDVGMINTASSVFNEKCFSTGQVKYLSALFPKAQWKYLFFEAAYKHIADVENFASLVSEIKDDYYIYRFKALLAK